MKTVSFLEAMMLNVSNMPPGAALGTVGFTMVLLPTIVAVNLV